MNSWVVTLTTTFLLLLILSRVNFYIDLHYCRRKDDDYLAITIHAFRKLLIYSMKIPAIELIQYNSLPWITSEVEAPPDVTVTHVGREQRFVKRLFKILVHNPARFTRLLRAGKRLVQAYRRYIDRLSRGFHCEKLDLKAIYGFEDAALTGIMMGVFGAMIGIMMTSLRNRVLFDTKPDIKVTPIFEHNHFEIEFRCIFRITLGNVITATIANLTHSLCREATRSG